MKKYLLFALALLVLLPACASRGEPMEFVRPQPLADAQRFSAADLSFDGITIAASTLDDALAKWGEPQQRTEVAEGQGYVLHYGFGQVYFNNTRGGDFIMNGITLLAEGQVGPRDIKIGDDYGKLIAAFPDELHQELTGGLVHLYAAGTDLNEDGTTRYIEPICYFSIDQYGTGGLSANDYVVENGQNRMIYYSAFFTNGKVSQITLNYGVPPIE